MGYHSHERTYILNICTHVTTLEAVLFPTKYRVLTAMSTKWFNIQSAICRVWQRAIVSNNCDTWSFSEKQTFFSKNREAFYRKAFSYLENAMNDLSVLLLLFFPPICLWKLENLWTSTMRVWLLFWDCSLLVTVQVCVFHIDSSFVFCSCSQVHATAVSWSIWTTDLAHFRIL